MKYFLSILFFVFSSSTFAQGLGVTRDLITGQVIPGAQIEIINLKNKVRSTALSDSTGSFHFSIQDTSVITVNAFDYEELTDTIFPGAKSKFYLTPASNQLNPFIVTGQYQPEKAENSVHKVRVISKEQIRAMGAVTLRDALTNEGNIRLSQDGILGSSMSLQGISGENVKILIDGVPMVGRVNGNIDLSQINMNNVERIEIIEGPMAVNYGSNALGGAINIITKQTSQEGFNGSVNSLYESVGQYNWDALMQFKKKKHSFSLSGGRNYFDGWIEGDPVEVLPKAKPADTNRFKTWNPKEHFFIQGDYSYKFKKITLKPYIQWNDEVILNRGYPRLPYYESAFDDEYRTQRFNTGIQSSGKIGDKHFLQFVAARNSFVRSKNTWHRDLTTLDKTLTETPGDQDTSEFSLYMSRASISQIKNKIFRYQIGYDINIESATGSRIKYNTQELSDYALFATSEISLDSGKLILKPGFRAALNSDYNAPIIPSFHAKYLLKKWNIRASYAQGFRAPSLKELYFLFVDINHNIIGNPDLKAEKSHNIQLNTTRTFLLNNALLQWSSAAYYNHIYNKITLGLTDIPFQFKYLNVDEFRSQGVRTDLQYQSQKLSVLLGATYNGVYNVLSEELDFQSYSYSPEIRSNLRWSFPKLKSTVNIFYKYTGKVVAFALDENDIVISGTLGSYNTLDVSISSRFWKNKLDITLGGKNLFNVTGITSESINQTAHSTNSGTTLTAWGASFFTSIKFNISK